MSADTTPASIGADALRSKLFEIVTDVYDRSMQIDDAVIEIMDIVPSAAQGAPAPAAQGDALDAARYRLLRRGQRWSVIDGIGDTLRGDELDAAIDAARAAKEGAKHD